MPVDNTNESGRESESIKPDTNINHYTIIEKIATGGTGNTYLAEDTKLSRKVVLKVLTGKYASDEKYKEMLIHEAKLSASLNHPNIVTVHEIIEYNNLPVIVMEYIEGENLLDLIKRQKPSVEEAVNIILQISSALLETHLVGIIHKDIKSSNIILNSKNQVKILDFGLAAYETDTDTGHSSQSSGTLYYLSPEQINSNEATFQSDLFSLGVVFYQLLSGELPFKGDYEAAVKYAIANEESVPLTQLNDKVDGQIERIVNKLMAKDRQMRYKSAVELSDDLNNWQSEKTMPVKPKKKTLGNVYTIVVLSVILLAILYFELPNFFSNDNDSPVTIAVLPFENLGSDEDEFFADAMTDALAHNLAKLDNLEVRSRNSSMLYKSTKLDNITIGEQLNVRYLLTGRIYWDKTSKDEVRIYAALIDIKNDKYIWTYQSDVKTESIFDVQTSISKDIVNALPLVLTVSEKEKLSELPTDNIEAYINFSRGQEYFNRSWNQDDMLIALDMFQKAVEKDEQFSAAYAMIARSYASLYWDHYIYTDEMCTKALENAEKSLSFEQKPVEGYIALGFYYYHCQKEFDRAIEIFQEGLNLFPNNSILYSAIAAVQRRQNKFVESSENFKYALKLDPRSHLQAMDVALTYGMLRNHDSSKHYIKKTIELAPDYSLAHIYNAWLPIIIEGDIETAREIIKKGLLLAELKESKYYWWLLRIIDPQQELEYEYKKTPGTDSVAYYLHMSQRNRLNNNRELESVYADSVISIVEARIIEYPNDARLNIALGLAYAGLRDKEKAFAYGTKALELAPVSKEAMDAPYIVLDFAEILLIFNEKETAFEQLQFLLTIPGFVTPVYFETDPLWKPLFEDTTYSNRLLTN